MDRDKIQQLIDERGIKSVEELQALINEVSAQQNALGRPEFLGLSPNQMQWMLYEPFEPESPFGFKVASDETLNEVPFLRICEAMLKHTVLQQSPFKLTESTGSLPVKVVKAVYETGGYRDPHIERGIAKLYKETDCELLHVAKLILEMAGITRKAKGKWHLTKAGEKITRPEQRNQLFRLIFKTFFQKYNWSYLDAYRGLSHHFPQSGATFSLSILSQFGAEARPADFYATCYIRAFPAFLTEEKMHDDFPFEMSDNLHSSYYIRFFYRFAYWFGLAEEIQPARYLPAKTPAVVQKSEILDHLFRFPKLEVYNQQ